MEAYELARGFRAARNKIKSWRVFGQVCVYLRVSSGEEESQ